MVAISISQESAEAPAHVPAVHVSPGQHYSWAQAAAPHNLNMRWLIVLESSG
ncbi:hypothetical protein Patl1_13824 [Pistacia atlantica]|uniref:Uncharacterized protein n=1 Tax=Pistacia atlantica TaxID=434234 RepID=A0ACC1AWX0_9ROSI|nr:hypothetical protein Patl1_13824 [Pistacia atlantica]